jgi:hypothetical protein
MKISRDQLKALVKECLVEILNEGLAGGQPIRTTMPQRPIAGVSEQRSVRRKPAFDPSLDRPVTTGRTPTHHLKEAVKREAGGNPIMEAIFADTARTTLPSMLAVGDSNAMPEPGSTGGGGLVQQEQFHGTPEQVFGEETAGRWADLAFAEPTPKKSA